MGYILPITPYQSIQYAERELREKPQPYRFVPVAKSMNELKYERYVERQDQESPLDHRKKRKEQTAETSINKNKVDLPVLEKICAEITGKGKSFSQYV